MRFPAEMVVVQCTAFPRRSRSPVHRSETGRFGSPVIDNIGSEIECFRPGKCLCFEVRHTVIGSLSRGRLLCFAFFLLPCRWVVIGIPGQLEEVWFRLFSSLRPGRVTLLT